MQTLTTCVDVPMQMREIRARVAEYFKLHPPLHLFSTSLPKQERGITPDSSLLNLFMLGKGRINSLVQTFYLVLNEQL